jgi:hypothetical protein
MKTRTLEGLTAELEQIVETLTALGVKASVHFQFLKITAPDGKRLVDVFPIIEQDADLVLMYMEKLRIRPVPRAAVLPFGSIDFYGQTFRAPRDAELFLQERYGKSWQVPMRTLGGKTVEV